MTPNTIGLLLLSLVGLACGTTAPAASKPAPLPEAAPAAVEPSPVANIEAVVEPDAATAPVALPSEPGVPLEPEDKKTSDAGVAAVAEPSDREYVACGCGCGAGGGHAQEVRECVPSRRKLQKIIKQDEASRKNPICASAGASLGQRYRLCPNVK